jgi:hypothetical protein
LSRACDDLGVVVAAADLAELMRAAVASHWRMLGSASRMTDGQCGDPRAADGEAADGEAADGEAADGEVVAMGHLRGKAEARRLGAARPQQMMRTSP